jgi:hypothetical protein
MRSNASLTLRVLAGFAAAPVAAALISVGVYEAFWHAGLMPNGAPIHSIDSAVALGAGVFILAVVVTGAAAVPGVMWLADKGPLTLGRLLALGAIVGNAPFAVIVAGIVAVQLGEGTPISDIPPYWYGSPGALVRIAMGIVAGAGAAATFWLVSVCGTRVEGGRSSLPL